MSKRGSMLDREKKFIFSPKLSIRFCCPTSLVFSWYREAILFHRRYSAKCKVWNQWSYASILQNNYRIGKGMGLR